ncbi:Variant surface glycoprotein [Trypanosoma congolense IL3000]|uniref:Variant surface glycoprotein n=1 Tax=Trypanosoma congolense (strain IL3000) TaxID=1068625 RepID=F9WGF1_TRYCI|nr:Variant surface glycoprotein [Trypanosoma congolense IL3000]
MIRMITFFMVLGFLAQSACGTDHNKEEHSILCKVLKTAVALFQTNNVGVALQRAVNKTIFGNESGGDLQNLISGLPTVYNDAQNTHLSRTFWCGLPLEGEDVKNQAHGSGYLSVSRPRWPGHSAPHDLMCLCTIGEKAWPLETSPEKDKLCGQLKRALGGGEGGWSDKSQEKKVGKEQITATWTNVAKPCLRRADNEHDLKEALDSFLLKLKNKSAPEKPNRYQLGEGTHGDYAACTGTPPRGVCVMYYNSTSASNALPWWTDLAKALADAAEIKAQKQGEKAETRKNKKAQKKPQAQKQENSQPQHAPSTSALRSPAQDLQEDEQKTTENISSPLATIEDTSGTPISRPSSWLLSAALLI